MENKNTKLLPIEPLIDAFVQLGHQLIFSLNKADFEELALKSKIENTWFTPENIKHRFEAISTGYLNEQRIRDFINFYHLDNSNRKAQKNIGIVAAGNISLAAWADVMYVLLSGNKVNIKLSSKDAVLMNFVFKEIIKIYPDLEDFIDVQEKLINYDAVIASGSNNTNRYFSYYFGKVPSVLRGSKTSIAILEGKETNKDLELLANDIFTYFGLGCKNVNYLLIPKGYDLVGLIDKFEAFSDYANHNTYMNNYMYFKSIYLLNKEKHLDNGFALIKEEKRIYSPVSVIHYSEYEDRKNLQEFLIENKSNIQSIISNGNVENSVMFGKAQLTTLFDYPDDVDVMNFLLSLN
jgi:hypothetical protein